MLFTSCMRDETRLDEGSIVTFKISAPAVSTRAAIEDTYGTGVEADDLHWAIFEQDENGNPTGDPIFDNVEEDFFAGDLMENTFNARLVKGKKYVALFWAQDVDAPYTVDWATQTVTMNETVSNNEKLDAFFNIHKFAITAGQETGEQKVELRRPFAQLNVAVPATDLAAAKAAGFELAKTGITLNVAKSFSLVTGAVGTAEDVTYTLANIPTDVTATLEGTEYQLVSFNYILVDAGIWDMENQAWTENTEKDLTDVTFNYGTADETLSQTFQNITVQRNHRTYIVGSLLSETVDFRVIILPDWEDPYYLNNMEAGSIEMVAEQTTTNNAAMGSAILTWNAVEGTEYYGVEYKGEELDKVNPDNSIRTKADEAATTLSYTVPEGTVTDATASFTIKAYNENDKVIARVVTDPIAVFSLKNRPEPELRVLNGALEMATDFDWTDSAGDDYNDFGNLHENGILVAAEVRFYKDNATTPAYTAYATCADQTDVLTTWRTGFNHKYVKGSNMFMAFKNWQWKEGTGSYGAATATMPEFEKGTYTVDYTAHYIAILGGVYNNKANDGTSNPDRMHFTAALESAVDNDLASLLAKAVARDGKSDLKITKIEGTTPEAVAEGYQGATVTWPAVDGAASYQVFVGATKVADATTNEATVTGLTDANKYKFIVKSLDANGNVIATSVESNEVQVWTLTGMPTPAVSFDGATLSVSNILDVYGVGYDVTITFTNGSLTHTATYNKAFDQDGVKSRFSGNGFMAHANTEGTDLGRFTKSSFDPCTTWYWDKTPAAADYQTKTEDAAPAFEVGEWTISYSVSYAPLINAYWSEKNSTEVMDKDNAKANRVNLKNKGADVLFDPANPIKLEGTLADKYVVGFNVEATPLCDLVELSWDPVVGATYEVYVGGEKVGETTETSYTYKKEGTGTYDFEVKVAGTETSATASAEVKFSMANWTAPQFSLTLSDSKYVFMASNMSETNYIYAGGEIKIYKDGASEPIYTLKNMTSDTYLNSSRGYGRWKIAEMDNRKDWTWYKGTTDEIVSIKSNGDAGEVNSVDASFFSAGNYTLVYTIYYAVNINGKWATHNGTNFVPQDTRTGATHVYFEKAENVLAVDGNVLRQVRSISTPITLTTIQ